VLALTAAIFALSGAAALTFETLWFHQADLAFGSGVAASSLVLAAFMAGLALGNAIAARRGDALRRPLRVFALLELGVAITGFALVVRLPHLGPLLAEVLGPLAPHPSVLGAARFAAAFALLIVPTTAMGLTLPILVRALATSTETFGPALGRLYGWNTLGAVAGVALAEGWAIGALGIRGTALAAAGTNLVAAAGALALSRWIDPGIEAAGAAKEVTEAAGRGWRWRAAAFGSGFALLALEVVGFRFLSLFVITRAETFAWMLCTVLLGIGAGGLVAGAALRHRSDARNLAAAAALACGAAVCVGYAAFPLVVDSLGPEKVTGTIPVLQLCAVLLLPTSILSGALFVLLGAGLRHALAANAETAGHLTVANTLGAAVGALTAGLGLLPGLGIERSLFALALLYASIGAGLALHPEARRRALPAAIAWGLAALLFPFGAMQSDHVRRVLAVYDVPEDAAIHVREGLRETIVWIEVPYLGQPYTQRLVTNGYSMSATDVQARRYMRLYAALPAAIHPSLESALLVSYGVGTTARALADLPEITHIDVVDISRDILEESGRAFPDPTRDPLRDPRVQVHVEDGRFFLATTPRRYDLITGEPPPPTLAGVVNLYTREYFELVHSRLAAGGMFTTWLPLRSLSDAAALSILRAFCDAFPDCSLWRGMSFELMLLGTRGASGPVPDAHFGAQWREPTLRAELEAVGLERPEQLGALFIADALSLADWTRDAAPLVDDRPRRITAPPRSLDAQHQLYAEWLDPRASRARFAESDLTARLLPERVRGAALSYFDVQHLLDTFGAGIRSDAWSERLTDLRAVLGRSALRTPVLWLLGSDADVQRIIDTAPAASRERADVQLHLAARAVADRNDDAALAALERAAREPEAFEHATALRLFLLCKNGQREEAARLARRSAPQLGRGPRIDDLWAFFTDSCGIGP